CSPISRTSLKTIRHSKAYIISAKSPLKSLRTIVHGNEFLLSVIGAVALYGYKKYSRAQAPPKPQ
ncbi:MAG: hypothetical protein ABMA02_17365, partial [Saprospiraceae bacterium]